jgi:hypothetical protein
MRANGTGLNELPLFVASSPLAVPTLLEAGYWKSYITMNRCGDVDSRSIWNTDKQG